MLRGKSEREISDRRISRMSLDRSIGQTADVWASLPSRWPRLPRQPRRRRPQRCAESRSRRLNLARIAPPRRYKPPPVVPSVMGQHETDHGLTPPAGTRLGLYSIDVTSAVRRNTCFVLLHCQGVCIVALTARRGGLAVAFRLRPSGMSGRYTQHRAAKRACRAG